MAVAPPTNAHSKKEQNILKSPFDFKRYGRTVTFGGNYRNPELNSRRTSVDDDQVVFGDEYTQCTVGVHDLCSRSRESLLRMGLANIPCTSFNVFADLPHRRRHTRDRYD